MSDDPADAIPQRAGDAVLREQRAKLEESLIPFGFALSLLEGAGPRCFFRVAPLILVLDNQVHKSVRMSRDPVESHEISSRLSQALLIIGEDSDALELIANELPDALLRQRDCVGHSASKLLSSR
jgi:hypothetical protein